MTAQVLALAASLALAHPGAVDEKGCHLNAKSGKRHCHHKSDVKKAAASGKWCVPDRNPSGGIKRDRKQKCAFIAANPCPITGSTNCNDKCPGWHVDHVVPLACCGADDPSNMAWTPAKENLAKGATCPWEPRRDKSSQ